jgi:DDE family transposase
MARRTKEGTSLKALVQQAIPVCREAERRLPRTGPGCKPTIPDWVMAVLIMVAVLKRRKTKSAQYRFLDSRRDDLRRWLGRPEFPSRSTYFDRYRRAHALLEVAIAVQGELAVASGLADASTVSVDKSLIEALGPRWNKSDRRRQRVPKKLRGVDRGSEWTHTKTRGWVQGYSYEVVVSAGKQGVVFPLLASAAAANAAEAETFLPKIEQLPETTDTVLVDSAYDSQSIADRVERRDEPAPRRRRFLCPVVARGKPPKGQKTSHVATPERKQRQEQMRTRSVRKAYRRRSTTVEPFNEWLKSAFELSRKVWHRGLDNNRTQLLAAICTYQLLIRHVNHRRRKAERNGQIQSLMAVL